MPNPILSKITGRAPDPSRKLGFVPKVSTGFFNEGDLILYGKYKNKKGRIVRLFTDEKGHPTIEVEPIPKGRKKNKIMGLFKIWHAPEGTEEKVVMSSIALRVAARFQEGILADRVAARVLEARRGETDVRGDIRIHQYADHFSVWDLTNAGKRGKTVKVLKISPNIAFSKVEGWMDRMDKAIQDLDGYDAIKGFFEDLLQDFPGEILIREEIQRGVDVLPGKIKRIDLNWSDGDRTEFRLTALPNEFTLVQSVEFAGKKKDDAANDTNSTFRQDTGYFNSSKKDAQVFYNWALANESSIKSMSMQDFHKLWSDLKIRYSNW